MMKRIIIPGILLMLVALAGCGVSERAEPVEYIHADFLVTEELLHQMIAELPPEIQNRITRLPQYFLELLFASLHELSEESMQLVDKAHSIPKDYEPRDLVMLDQYQSTLFLTRPGMELSAYVIPDLLAMSIAANNQGIEMPVSSAYRSYEHQVWIYNNSLERYGKVETEQSVAYPGHSQHQLGNTIDFGSISDGFADTPAGQWLMEHGWRFGFSLSYPPNSSEETGYRYESWHYRYIGRAAAKLERIFFDSNQQLLFTYLAQYRSQLTDILVPITTRY